MANSLNVIIITQHVKEWDRNILFPDDELVFTIREDAKKTMLDLLVYLKAFGNKNQARNNWNGPIEIPSGWSEFTVGRQGHRLNIWNPRK
jgi:hypothetical protein